ncbi:tyrosine-protein phosphatase [Streptodolium elevatio]|uniref:Tyrosine-protein phosphatase n=1 Tax=Streptodolium elevatio TaxID=3157996 RepID=A0ABV3DGF0_9ACTN
MRIRGSRTAIALGVGAALLGGGIAAGPAASAAQSAAAHAPPTAQRLVPVEGTANFRDLGGYRTYDGEKTRSGVLYRSEALNKVTPNGVAQMAALKLKGIVDFRTAAEIAANGPDKYPAGVPNTNLAVSDGGLMTTLYAVITSGDPVKQEQILGNGRAAQLMVDMYRTFVDDPAIRAQFAATAKGVANGTVSLYHCSAGKDRAGWMTAILLTAVGVPTGTVNQDYLLSNQYLKPGNDALKQQLLASGRMQNPSLLDPLLGVDQRYLDAARAAIDARYGSFGKYLTDGLGLDILTLVKLRQRLVT